MSQTFNYPFNFVSNSSNIIGNGVNSFFNSNTLGNLYTTGGNIGINTTSPIYQLDVNGNINFVGNLTKNGVTFGGSQWITIGNNIAYTNGNVGINTTSPAYQLDVNGNINFAGNLTKNGVTFGGSQWITIGNNIAYTNGNVGINTTSPQFTLDVNGQTRINNGLLSTFNSNTIGSIFTTGGNVGINTTSPQFTLDILGTTRITSSLTTGSIYSTNLTTTNIVGTNSTISNLNISGNITVGGSLIVLGTLTSVNVTSVNIIDNNITTSTIIVTGGSLNATFNTNTIGSIFTTGGNVGINTTSPQFTLDVNGTTRITGILNTVNLTTQAFTFGNNIGTNETISTILVTSTGSLIGNSNTIGSIFTTGGNVGINTTSPQFTLDVTGTGRFTSSLTTGSIYSTNLTSTNIVGTTLSVPNVLITNITTTTLLASNLSSSNLLSTNITTTNLLSTNTSISNLITQTSTVANQIITNQTVNNILITNTGSLSGNSNTIGSIFTTGGNVGINTTSPQFTLDVSGTARFTSSLTTGSIFSTNLTTTNIVGTTLSVPNVLITNITTTTLLASNLSSSNLLSTNITTTNLLSTNTSISNLITQTSTVANQIVTNQTVNNILITNTGSLSGNSNTIGSIFTTGGNVGINTTSPQFTLDVSGTARFTSSLTTGSIFSTNLTTTNIVGTTLSVPNVLITNITTTTLLASNLSSSNLLSTNITTTNLLSTNTSISNLIAQTSTVANQTVTNQTVNNILITNTGSLIGNSNTIGSIFTTGGNVGINTTSPQFNLDVSGTARFTSSLTTGSIYSTNLTSTNIVGTTLSVPNVLITNITTTTLLVSNLSSSNLLSTNITTTNLLSTNTSITNLITQTSTVANQIVTNQTTGTILVTGFGSLIGNSNTIGSIFTTGGNVGINNITPQFTLDLNGSLRQSSSGQNTITYRNTITGTTLDISPGYRGGANFGGWTTLDPNNGTTGSNGIYIYDGLEIAGSSSFGNTLINGILNTNNIVVNGTNGVNMSFNSGNGIYGSIEAYTTGNTAKLPLSLNGFGGNVGVNTTTPVYPLDVNGQARVNNGLLSVFNSNTVGSIFTTGGNVGINTTSPQFTLDINGTTRITSSLTTGSIYSTNLTTTNIVSTFITTVNLISTTATIPNLSITNSTITNVLLTNSTITNVLFTNSTFSNLVANNVNLGIASLFSGSFIASNNIITPTPVTGLLFTSTNIRYFEIKLTVNINTSVATSLDSVFIIRGNYNDSGWSIITSYIGDNSNVIFSVNTSGQILYTSTNITNFSNSTFRYKVEQFTTNGTYTSILGNTVGSYIIDSIQINNTTDSVPGTSNGALYVLGGATISKQVNIQSTNNTIGLGTGGSLTVLGGASINKNLIIGTGLASVFNSNTIGSLYTTGGNVGINTTTPQFTLDVIGNSRMTINSTVASVNDMIFMGYQSSNNNIAILDFNYVSLGNASNSLGLGLYGANNKLVVTGNGFIGINTTSPQFTLDINGQTRINNGLLSTFNSNTIGSIFTTGGNVGINTTTPQFTLDILGTTRITSSLTTGSVYALNSTTTNIVGTNSTISNLNISGNITVGGSLIVLGTLTSVNVTSVNIIDNNITTSSIIVTGGSLNATFNSNTIGSLFTTGGNVGINTTSPAFTLDVSGNCRINNNSVQGILLGGSTGTNPFSTLIASSRGSLEIGIAAVVTNFSGSANPGDIVLRTNNTNLILQANSANSSNIYISTSGNVGINTGSPTYPLHVSGNIYVGPSTFTTATGGSTGTINTIGLYTKSVFNTNVNGFPAVSGTVGNAIALRVRGNDDASMDFGINSGNGGWLQVNNWVNGYNQVYPLILNPNGGNIGINTTSPGYTLDINGTLRATALNSSQFTPPHTLINTGTTNPAVLSLLTPNVTIGSFSELYLGQSLSTGNSGQLNFLYNGSNNTGNSLSLSLYGSATGTSSINLINNGNVGIGTTSGNPARALQVSNTNMSQGSISVVNTGDARYHLYNAGAITEWLFGQKSTSRNDFTITALNNGTENDKFTILPSGNIGINTTSPQFTLDVNGTIARSGIRLPRFDNGSFSAVTIGSIPILFTDSTYNFVEIKVNYIVSTVCNVVLTGNTSSNGSGTNLPVSEHGETTVRNTSQNTPVYTNSGYISQLTEGLGLNNIFTIKITRTAGGNTGRNYYSFDTVYCWSTVGTGRVYGMGHIDSAANLSNQLLSIQMTPSTGTISATYNTQYGY